jgi:guanylate kinase
LSPTEFDTKIAEGAFLEWAWVHQKHRYGTLTSSVIDPLRAGKNLIINIDVQGVDSFHDAAATQPILERHMTTVYIDVPIEILKERLAGRGTDGEEEIARRLRTAEAEEREKHKFDYLIVSKSKDEDFQALKEIWKQAQVRLKEQR